MQAAEFEVVEVKGSSSTPPNSEIICGQNVGTKVVCGMILSANGLDWLCYLAGNF